MRHGGLSMNMMYSERPSTKSKSTKSSSSTSSAYISLYSRQKLRIPNEKNSRNRRAAIRGLLVRALISSSLRYPVSMPYRMRYTLGMRRIISMGSSTTMWFSDKYGRRVNCQKIDV